MQSQKTVFRPLNARTPPAADTDRAGPALPPSKQISKGNRQSAFPRRWIRCGGVIPFVYIIWISRTATPSRRNGGVVAPERRYRLAGTVAPLRRNSRACKKGAPISPAGQVPKACRLRLPIRQSAPSTPNRRPSRRREKTFPWARPPCVVSGVQAACFTMDGRKRLPAPFPKRRAKEAPAGVRICEKECADGR